MTTAVASSPSQRDITIGASLLFTEILLVMIMSMMVKWLAPPLSVMTVLLFRYALCLPLLVIIGFYQRRWQLLQVNRPKVLVMRSICGVAGLLTWFQAVIYLDISLATALSQMVPIFIVILAPLMLGERVGPRRFMAVLFGFVGVIILIDPWQSSINIGLVYGLAAPLIASLMFLFLRQLGQSDSPVSTSIWYNLAGMLVFGSLVMGGDYAMPQTQHEWLLLVLIGVMASGQQITMAASHGYAPASTLAPMHYTSIPMSVLIGIMFFDEVISISFVIGTVIIIAANYYILIRQRQREGDR